jgi:hypothetical protein
MTNTQIQQATGLTEYKDHSPHMRRVPQRPTGKSGIHAPRGDHRWTEWERQQVGGMSKVEGGNVGLVAAPTSCAETRLLPAGRTKTMHVDKTGVSPKLKQARVPRRADQDPILAAYKTDGSSTPYKPPTLTTRIGVYGVEPLPKEHKVTLKQPRYDPINHKYDGDIWESAKQSPIFEREGKRRLDNRIVPGNLSARAPYSHHRDATGNILNNQVSAEAEIAQMRLNSWKFEKNAINARRDACLSSQLVQEILDQDSQVKNLAAHGLAKKQAHVHDEINDTSVSPDAPAWLVDQATRANPVSGVHKRGGDGRAVGHTARIDMDFGTVADNAVSGDGPDWMVDATKRIDPTAVLERYKPVQGVRSTFFDDRGNQISDAAVSADAPTFLVEANQRIDENNLTQPLKRRIPWHNRTVQPTDQQHPSQESSKTSDVPARPSRKIDYPNAAGFQNSMDAPSFMTSNQVRAREEAKRVGQPSIHGIAKRDRPNWVNRIVMGGDRGRVPLLDPKNGVDEYVAGFSAESVGKECRPRPAAKTKEQLEGGWNSGSSGYGKGFV